MLLFSFFTKAPSTTTLSTTTITTTTTTTTPLPSTTPFVCADQAPNCAELGPAMCLEDKAFAMRNCAVFCLLCTRKTCFQNHYKNYFHVMFIYIYYLIFHSLFIYMYLCFLMITLKIFSHWNFDRGN